MLKQWKKWRPWKRWVLIFTCVLAICLFVGVGLIYYQVQTISLSDIQERRLQQNKGNLDGNNSPPAILADSIEKASEFTEKPIQAQDALDVAAVLLKSGLSLKEVYFLTGKVSDQLPIEEKQKIRDLLLSKLSKDEIQALRSITKEYGKTLLILDPNYPIELIGVYDEAERARIMKELKDRNTKESLKETQTNTKTIVNSESKASDIPEAVQAKDTSLQEYKKIEDKYTSSINQLKASCEAEVSVLVNQIANVINQSKAENQPLSADALQNNFMTKIAKAEQNCDNKFTGMMNEAQVEFQQKGLEVTQIDLWKQQYNLYKEQARIKAITELSVKIN